MPGRSVHLGATLYDALQQFVHQGHGRTADVILGLLEPGRGETVVEIGCGTGALARHFIERGFDYVGVDPDAERIEAARKRGRGRFVVGEADVLETMDVRTARHVFIHGVLHHLDDEYCRNLIRYLLEWAGSGRLVISEPVRPDRWWLNPPGALAMRLDEGRFTRTVGEWLDLFGPAVEWSSVRKLWPRWPVSMLDVRLSAATGTAGSRASSDMKASV